MSRVFATNADFLSSATGPFSALPAGGATFCIWLKTTSLVTQYSLLTVGTTGSSNQRFTLQQTAAGLIGAQEFDTTSNSGNSSVAVPDTTGWHLAVATFNGNHTNRNGFMDGANKGGTNALKAATLTPVTRISGSPNNGTPFAGKLAHAAIWNGILSDPEIAQLMSFRPYKIQPANLLDYWPMTGNQPIEPSYGSAGTDLTVNGTTFDTDNPVFSSDFDSPLDTQDYF